MYTLYKFHFLNGISEINQLFDDILIILPAPVYINICKILQRHKPVCTTICNILLIKSFRMSLENESNQPSM